MAVVRQAGIRWTHHCRTRGSLLTCHTRLQGAAQAEGTAYLHKPYLLHRPCRSILASVLTTLWPLLLSRWSLLHWWEAPQARPHWLKSLS